MSRKLDDAEEEPSEYYPYDNEYSDSDNGSYRDDEESLDGYAYQEHITFDDVKIRPVLMKRLKLGNAILQIYSNGAIRDGPFTNTSYGMLLAGTPFRIHTIEYQPNDFRTYFVHELVWQAFHGQPPTGWEVRHKPEYTMFARKKYSNALHHLTTFPVVVSKLI